VQLPAAPGRRAGPPILVVDDDPQILEFVSLALADEGYAVVTASNGAVALERVREHSPALILLDMTMPVMDGWQFAREYRANPGPHAPIVCVTAAQNAGERAAQINADASLPKPFDLDNLLDLVEQLTARAVS
jgi:CheY-like chemotaxis protein